MLEQQHADTETQLEEAKAELEAAKLKQYFLHKKKKKKKMHLRRDSFAGEKGNVKVLYFDKLT